MSNDRNTLPCTVTVEREKETRWMVRFKERIGADEQPRVGTIYLNKALVGNATRLTVTIVETE